MKTVIHGQLVSNGDFGPCLDASDKVHSVVKLLMNGGASLFVLVTGVTYAWHFA